MKVLSLNSIKGKANSNQYWNCECIHCGFRYIQNTVHLKRFKNENRSGCLFCKTPTENLVGKIYGSIKVLGINKEVTMNRYLKTKKKDTYYDCECIKCHAKSIKIESTLKKITRKGLEACKLCPKTDLTGQTIGFWTVLEQGETVKQPNGISYITWKCRCICGIEREIPAHSLIRKKSLSCGCKRKELVSKKLLGVQRKQNIYDLSGDYGICYNEDKTRFCYFDLEDYKIIKQHYWIIPNRSDKYVISENKTKRIYMHRFVMGLGDYDKIIVVDHINHDKSDNRKKNLRICTQSENSKNVKARKNNTSGYIGVSWDKNRNKWHSQITFNRKCINLGRFENIEDAIAARKEAEKKYFGEFAYDPEKDMRLLDPTKLQPLPT